MCLEAPRRPVPPALRSIGLRGVAERVGVPARVPVRRAGGRPVVRVVSRDRVLEQAAARRRVRDAEPAAGRGLLSGVPRGRLAGGDRGAPHGAGRGEGAVVAGAAATLRISASALPGGGEGGVRGRSGPRARLGEARGQGHRRAAAGGLMRSRALALLTLGALLAGAARAQHAAGPQWTGSARAGTLRFTDTTSLGALGGVLEYPPLAWLRFHVAPPLGRATNGAKTASGVGDVPLALEASTKPAAPLRPELPPSPIPAL